MIAEHYPAYENKPWQPSNSPLRQRKSAQRYWLFDLGAERQSAVECAGFLNLGEVSDPGLLDLRSSTILARKQRWHRIYSLSGWIAQVFNTRDSSILCAFLRVAISAVATLRFLGEIFGTHPENSRAQPQNGAPPSSGKNSYPSRRFYLLSTNMPILSLRVMVQELGRCELWEMGGARVDWSPASLGPRPRPTLQHDPPPPPF